MFNFTFSDLPPEFNVVTAALVAAAFFYFFPHIKNHYLKKGYERGVNDAFVEKVGSELEVLKTDRDRHERKINRFGYQISSIERKLGIRDYSAEQSPDGASKGR